MNLREIGRHYEDMVADKLRKEGYTIVTRRWKSRRGEIDLIALDGDVLVFIEVKARGLARSLPELAVTERKLRHLCEAASRYRQEMEWGDRPYRWDVIAITPDSLRHHRDIDLGGLEANEPHASPDFGI